MAAAKAKKQTSSRLKARKKKVNKWLILGGVAAVAVIGAAVVRFSSASHWYSLWRSDNTPYYIRKGGRVGTYNYGPYTNGVKLTRGGVYRFCLRGYNVSDGPAHLELKFSLLDLNRNIIGDRAVSTKKYTSRAWSTRTAELHCSAEFSATKASYIAFGEAYMYAGNGTFTPTALSIDQLR